MTNVNTFQGTVGIGTNAAQDKLHVNGSLLIQHDTTYDTGGTAGWYKIGVWDPTGITGARLKIRFLGVEGYSSQTGARGGETILYASCNNNSPSTVANMSGRIHAYGTPAITEVKFVHLDSSRHKFEIRAYVKTYVKMSMSVECNQTDSFAKFFTASSDPGDDSATVGSALFSHVFDNSGNVGIGTGGPQDIAHIYKDGGNDPHGLLIENKNSGTGQATLKFGVATASESTAGLSKAGIFFKRAATNGRGDLLFCMDNANDTNDVGTGDHALTLYRDGNVGIGTLVPGCDLHIQGSSGEMLRATDGTRTFYMGCDSNDPWVGTSTNHKLRFINNGQETARFNTGSYSFNMTQAMSTMSINPQTYRLWNAYNQAPTNTNGDFYFSERGMYHYVFCFANGEDVNITHMGWIGMSANGAPQHLAVKNSSYTRVDPQGTRRVRFYTQGLPAPYNNTNYRIKLGIMMHA